LLGHVREVALGAYAHQDVPFDRVVEELRPARLADQTPFFRILFALQNVPLPAPQMADLTVTPFEIANAASKYDVTLTSVEDGGGLAIHMQYNAGLFLADTAARVLLHLSLLLGAMADDPDRGVLDLPMLSDDELQQLAEWSHR
jgi:aspartate racemase